MNKRGLATAVEFKNGCGHSRCRRLNQIFCTAGTFTTEFSGHHAYIFQERHEQPKREPPGRKASHRRSSDRRAAAGDRLLCAAAGSRRRRRNGLRSAPPGIVATRSSAASTSGTCSPSARPSASTAQQQGIDGPLFLGMDTHALSAPACASALEVLAANGVEVMLAERDEYTPTPAVSHAILVHNRGRERGFADGIVVTPSHNPPTDGGFKYNPPHGGPADKDVTGESRSGRMSCSRMRCAASNGSVTSAP